MRSSGGSNVVLRNASGEQVLNTLIAYGEQLPRNGDADLVQRVFASGEPAISDLYVGGLHRPMVSIDVPVFRSGKVVYDLSIGFFSERLGDILRQEQLPASWVASVFDSKGINVARTRAADQFVGQKGVPALVNKMAEVSEGIVETQTLEGVASTALFSRSHLSSWAVAIYVPTAKLTLQLWKSMTLSIAITLILLALGLIAARFTGERLARPIRALAGLALAHGRGERVEIPPLHLKEADDLARALVEGSRLLEDRTASAIVRRGRDSRFDRKGTCGGSGPRPLRLFRLSQSRATAPLTAVLGCSKLIARYTRAKSQERYSLEYCGRIDTAVHHLISVIDEILDYAKYEAHEIALRKEPLDVAAEVRSAVNLLEARAGKAGVELRYGVASNLPPLCADQIRLRQILLNLLSNALKFTPQGGIVTVNAALTDDAQLEIRVEDTGTGISADDLPRVMQPFGQVLNAQTKKRKGTGLGLPLTKGLVELHGGSFTLASALGVGTTVTVRLPILSATAEASGKSGSLAPPRPSNLSD